MDCASDRLLSPTSTPSVQRGPTGFHGPLWPGCESRKPDYLQGVCGDGDSCSAPWGRGSRGPWFLSPSTLARTGLLFSLLCPHQIPPSTWQCFPASLSGPGTKIFYLLPHSLQLFRGSARKLLPEDSFSAFYQAGDD